MKIRNIKKEKGITLVALVVTIIILIILVGIVVGLVEDDNGLLAKAERAVNIHEGAEGKEQSELGKATDLIQGGIKDVILSNSNDAEKLEKYPEDYKHPDQSETNGDRAVGADGQPVNMDLWHYEIYDSSKTITLRHGEYYDIYSAYKGDFTDDGRILGSVPKYIKVNGRDGIYTVTSMDQTFYNCGNLYIAPEIPDTVEHMSLTFEYCSNLSTPPTIPNSVTSMRFTFKGCTSLETAPVIPNSVTSMESTFYGCTSLETAPVIPNSVTDMTSTFHGCTSLTTVPNISNSVTELPSTFFKCTSLKTVPDLPDSLTDIREAFNGCTGMITAPILPDSVTKMDMAFERCTSLATVPNLPNNVKQMWRAFKDCTSLTTVPEIPSSVTNLTVAFSGCTSLTGIITIHATELGYDSWYGSYKTTSVFEGVTKEITVRVPNGSHTYNSYNKEYGSSSNIHIEAF